MVRVPPLHVHSSPKFRQCIVHALIKDMSQCFTPSNGPHLTWKRHDGNTAQIVKIACAQSAHITKSCAQKFKAKKLLSKMSDMVHRAAGQWWMPQCCVLFATSQDCLRNLYTNSSDPQWRRRIWSKGKENSNAPCAATVFDETLDLLEILQLQSAPHWGIVSLQVSQRHQRRGSMTKQFSAAMDEVLTVHLSIHFSKWTEHIVTFSQISVCRGWCSCARTILSWDCADSPRCWLHPHISQSSGMYIELEDNKKLSVTFCYLKLLAKTKKDMIWTIDQRRDQSLIVHWEGPSVVHRFKVAPIPLEWFSWDLHPGAKQVSQNVVRIKHRHSHRNCGAIVPWWRNFTLNFHRLLQGRTASGICLKIVVAVKTSVFGKKHTQPCPEEVEHCEKNPSRDSKNCISPAWLTERPCPDHRSPVGSAGLKTIQQTYLSVWVNLVAC